MLIAGRRTGRRVISVIITVIQTSESDEDWVIDEAKPDISGLTMGRSASRSFLRTDFRPSCEFQEDGERRDLCTSTPYRRYDA